MEKANIPGIEGKKKFKIIKLKSKDNQIEDYKKIKVSIPNQKRKLIISLPKIPRHIALYIFDRNN